MNKNLIVVEHRSRFGFEKTVETLISEAEKRDWKVPAVHDLQQSLAKSGKSVRPVKVIEICKPAYSGQMLERNDERIISVMMPCRISAFEKEDGLTYVGLINIGSLASGLPENVAEVMQAASDETIQIVKSVS